MGFGSSQAPMSPYRESRQAALWGIGVSLTLGGLKLVGGLHGRSLALVSDAFHSLVDAAVASTLLGALTIAQRPADREHPYGHGRIEAVAGAAMALVLLGLAASLAYYAVGSRGVPHPPPAGFTLVIAGVGACVQELLYRHGSRVARRTGSAALLATAWDYRLDAMGSVAVVLGVALARWADTPWADHAAAFLIAGTICWVGGGLLWENVQSLIDRQAGPEILQQVRTEAQSVAGVRAVEKLRVRRTGLEHLVDIHIQVDDDKTVRRGHEIAHAVKDRLVARIPSISDVMVHVEPFLQQP